MLIIQILAVILLVFLINLIGYFIFYYVKEFFFTIYVKERDQYESPKIKNISWYESMFISICILIYIYYEHTSNTYPNSEILNPLIIGIQLYITYRIFKLKNSNK